MLLPLGQGLLFLILLCVLTGTVTVIQINIGGNLGLFKKVSEMSGSHQKPHIIPNSLYQCVSTIMGLNAVRDLSRNEKHPSFSSFTGSVCKNFQALSFLSAQS